MSLTNISFSPPPRAAYNKQSTLKSTRQQSVQHREPVPFTGLTGPSYSISGSTEKFKLPPPSSLQPGLENNPGRLESWPVHSLNPTKLNLSLKEERLSSPGRKKALVSVMPKPKFLEQLESYLLKELRFLGCSAYGPRELRLQAHREVFEYLIEDFKTYQPLLSAIKNEYDLFIEWQKELIKELEPLEVHKCVLVINLFILNCIG